MAAPRPQDVEQQTSESLLEASKAIAAQFEFPDDRLNLCVQQFIAEMRLGLSERRPAMCQIPTYVTEVAKGTEKGLSLAVDLGGTMLRVCSAELHGDNSYTAKHSRVVISRDLMTTREGQMLFGFIASQIKLFLANYHPEYLEWQIDGGSSRQLSLGFTFSFPAYQSAIDSGVLLRWTKGFDIPDAVGRDVCALLQDQLDRLKLPVKVAALVNDAAGAIMSRAYSLPLSQTHTSIGAIFGTGTNAVYLEKISSIVKPIDGDFDTSTGEMFISIEWGSFDNALKVLPNTQYDADLDQASLNQGNQIFEKRVSGMFLGELVRLVMAKMCKSPDVALFSKSKQATIPARTAVSLEESWSLDSTILSVAAADKTKYLIMLRTKLEDMFGFEAGSVALHDAQAIQMIANAIGKRAARLAGMALGAVILQGRAGLADLSWVSNVDIALDGSVAEFYPGFEMHLREALRAIPEIGCAGNEKIVIGITKDGSSVGAAIIALQASEAAQRKLLSSGERNRVT